MHPQRPSPLELLRIADKIGCYTARTSYARHRTTSIQIGRNHRPPCRNEATYEPQRLLPAQHHPAIARTKQQAQRQHDPIRSTKLGCRSAHRAYRYYRQRMFHAQIGLYFIGKALTAPVQHPLMISFSMPRARSETGRTATTPGSIPSAAH